MWRGIFGLFSGIFALFFRSLRSDSRAVWVHACWFFLLIVIYISMSIAQAQSMFYGAPGLLLFQYVIYCNAVFVTLLGISYFSSVISEEKEEDTLGLMTMAGINPLGILLGKSTTRLFQVGLLLAVQYPFTLLAITLGGLTPEQIYSAYAALLAFTILLANMGLFCSVACNRNRTAAALTTLMMIAYIFGPLFARGAVDAIRDQMAQNNETWVKWGPQLEPTLMWIYQSSVFIQLKESVETGHEFSWTPQLISNSIGGVLFFFAAWGLFGFVPHEIASEATARVMVPRRVGRFRWLSAGRTWPAALAWKDFHFISGGWIGLVARSGLYVGLYWLAYLANCTWRENRLSDEFVRWYDVTWGFQVFVVPLFAVDCSLCMSRLFQEELRQQTLSSLLMLPGSITHLFYTKLAGCVAGLIPGMVALTIAFVFLDGAKRNLMDIIDEPAAWWFAANLFLLIHLCAMLSLYMRWGAFATSLALTIGSMIMTVMLVEIVVVLTRMRMTGTPDGIFGFLAVVVAVACIGCHFVILLRLPVLGER